MAQQILYRGWIEATPENIKAYMDGFIMAELKSSEETQITGEEYLELFSIRPKSIPISEVKDVAIKYDERNIAINTREVGLKNEK